MNNNMNNSLSAQTLVDILLKDRSCRPVLKGASAFAPANIALVKYWGKRNADLNLPVTSSLSLGLKELGAETEITLNEGYAENIDRVILNNQNQDPNSIFYKRVSQFLDLFRKENLKFQINTKLNIPVASGLASSSAGFAALVLALDKFFSWELDKQTLSILARLGSGSACRSFWPGFVEWQRGSSELGLDSQGSPLTWTWPELRIGILMVSAEQKLVSSRQAMERSMLTSPFYTLWPKKVEEDLQAVKTAILHQNFSLLGEVTEQNSLAMHALMSTAFPPIVYAEPSTLTFQKKIWDLRNKGLLIYFTSDAGPNLKLLFLDRDYDKVCNEFGNLVVINPF